MFGSQVRTQLTHVSKISGSNVPTKRKHNKRSIAAMYFAKTSPTLKQPPELYCENGATIYSISTTAIRCHRAPTFIGEDVPI